MEEIWHMTLNSYKEMNQGEVEDTCQTTSRRLRI